MGWAARGWHPERLSSSVHQSCPTSNYEVGKGKPAGREIKDLAYQTWDESSQCDGRALAPSPDAGCREDGRAKEIGSQGDKVRDAVDGCRDCLALDLAG